MATATLRQAAQRDSTQAMVRWRAAVREAADPAVTKPVAPAVVRELAQLIGLDDDQALDLFEGDVAAVDRVARLQAGVEILDRSISEALKPWKTLDGLHRAIDAAKAEVDRLEAVLADVQSYGITRGHELAAVNKAKLMSPRMFPQ